MDVGPDRSLVNLQEWSAVDRRRPQQQLQLQRDLVQHTPVLDVTFHFQGLEEFLS